MIFNFLKNNKKDESDDTLFTKIGSLLIHIAKIDENYTDKEKEIISKTLLELGAERENLDQIILDAEKKENDSFSTPTFSTILTPPKILNIFLISDYCYYYY